MSAAPKRHATAHATAHTTASSADPKRPAEVPPGPVPAPVSASVSALEPAAPEPADLVGAVVPAGRAAVAHSSTFKATLANKDVVGLFNDTVSSNDDPTKLPIVHKKYLEVETLVKRFRVALHFIHDMSQLAAQFPVPRSHLAGYLTSLDRQAQEAFVAPDISKHLGPPTLEDGGEYTPVPKELAKKCVCIYNSVKTCNLVNIIVVTCKNLTPYKGSLEDVDHLGDGFLLDAGHVLAPFPSLPQLNVKHIYQTFGDKDRKLLLTVLSRVYTIAHRVYELVTSPDANLDELVRVVLASIDDVKKAVPRCDDAFRKIAESVDMLRSNFTTYHKDYVVSNNPSIILENFVIDVSRSAKNSTAVTGQFRRIIMHYRSMVNQNDPKLKQLFGQAEANFRDATRSEAAIGIADETAAEPPASDPGESKCDETKRDESKRDETQPGKSQAAKNRKKKAKARAKAKQATSQDVAQSWRHADGSECSGGPENCGECAAPPLGGANVVITRRGSKVLLRTKKFATDGHSISVASSGISLEDLMDIGDGFTHAIDIAHEAEEEEEGSSVGLSLVDELDADAETLEEVDATPEKASAEAPEEADAAPEEADGEAPVEVLVHT